MKRAHLMVGVPLAVLLALLMLLGAGLRRDPKVLPSPLVDRPAPAFRLATLGTGDGRSGLPAHLSADDLRGQVWMLNVWASWCTACQLEHPVLMDFARSGVLPVYGLNYKDAPEPARGWLARHGNPYQASLSDPEGSAGMDWGVYGVPETFIVDAQGVVRFKHTGPLTPEVLREQVLPLVRRLRG